MNVNQPLAPSLQLSGMFNVVFWNECEPAPSLQLSGMFNVVFWNECEPAPSAKPAVEWHV